MRSIYRRSILAAAVLAAFVPSSTLFAAEKPAELRIDWATYNPVSMLFKDKGWFEKEFAKDGIEIRWVQTHRRNSSISS